MTSVPVLHIAATAAWWMLQELIFTNAWGMPTVSLSTNVPLKFVNWTIYNSKDDFWNPYGGTHVSSAEVLLSVVIVRLLGAEGVAACRECKHHKCT